MTDRISKPLRIALVEQVRGTIYQHCLESTPDVVNTVGFAVYRPASRDRHEDQLLRQISADLDWLTYARIPFII